LVGAAGLVVAGFVVAGLSFWAKRDDAGSIKRAAGIRMGSI